MTLHLFPYLTRIAHPPKHRCAVPLTPFAPSISVKCSLFAGTLRRESTRRNKKSRLRRPRLIGTSSTTPVWELRGKRVPTDSLTFTPRFFFRLRKIRALDKKTRAHFSSLLFLLLRASSPRASTNGGEIESLFLARYSQNSLLIPKLDIH